MKVAQPRPDSRFVRGGAPPRSPIAGTSAIVQSSTGDSACPVRRLRGCARALIRACWMGACVTLLAAATIRAPSAATATEASPDLNATPSIPGADDATPASCTSATLTPSQTTVSTDQQFTWTAQGFQPGSLVQVSSAQPGTGNPRSTSATFPLLDALLPVNEVCSVSGRTQPVATESGASVLIVSGKAFPSGMPLTVVANLWVNSHAGEPASAVPFAPSDLVAVPEGRCSIGLSWTDNSDNEDGFRISYTRRDLSGPPTVVTSPRNATSLVLGGLTPGVGYCFKVSAVNAAGTSNGSGTVCAETPSGSQPPVAQGPATPVTGAPSPTRAAVIIVDFAFRPPSTDVHVGDTMVWTNNGPSVHTATSDAGLWDTGRLPAGQSGSFTFTSAGIFGYHCTVHPGMRGSVTVTS